jgi:pSer/pThr/pTyr-binding forkhead associated (FHA) protein
VDPRASGQVLGRRELADLGTTNGSFVNGKQVQSSRLEAGDRLLLGDAAFELKLVR